MGNGLDALKESTKYLAVNPRKRNPRIYSYAVNDAVIARIPPSIIEAMARVGWNPFGVYEVVDEELKKEKREQKKAKHGT